MLKTKAIYVQPGHGEMNKLFWHIVWLLVVSFITPLQILGGYML